MKKEKNKKVVFDGLEDLEILIVSLAITYGLTQIQTSSVGLKIVIGSLILVEAVTSINVGRSIINYIKDCRDANKKNNNIELTNEVKEKVLENEYNIEKEKSKEIDYEKEAEELKYIDYNMSYTSELDKPKQFILKK